MLIHRQCLTQISREIRIEAVHDTHVVGKQLQRQDRQERIDLRIRFGDDGQIVGVGAQAGVYPRVLAKKFAELKFWEFGCIIFLTFPLV
jgi:hypothetical protein